MGVDEEVQISESTEEAKSSASTIIEVDHRSSNQNSPPSLTTTTLRQEAGQVLASISDTINSNLITARYATFLSITALTVWGVSISPLFFRFKRISDIPITYFQQRRTIPCRLVHIANITSTKLSRSGMWIPYIPIYIY